MYVYKEEGERKRERGKKLIYPPQIASAQSGKLPFSLFLSLVVACAKKASLSVGLPLPRFPIIGFCHKSPALAKAASLSYGSVATVRQWAVANF
jgi:hypothetical protein